MGFAEKIEGGNYTHDDVVDMFRWVGLAKANEKMLIMERENAEKREYEALGRANELEARMARLTILEAKAGVIYECAKENQSDCCFAATAYEQAMVAASNAENKLRNAITSNALQQNAQSNPLHNIPPEGGALRKLGIRLAELLDEDQWSECEEMLFEIQDEAMYRAMFENAIRSLATIDEALGLEADGCNEPERTLEAIAELKAKAARGEDLARTVMADNTGCA